MSLIAWQAMAVGGRMLACQTCQRGIIVPNALITGDYGPISGIFDKDGSRIVGCQVIPTKSFDCAEFIEISIPDYWKNLIA